MIRYTPARTAKFRKDYKRLKKRGYDMLLLDDVIVKLANGETLHSRYCDHPLRGDRHGYRNCHILGNWVLIYKIDKAILTLILSETGTHSDILE